MYFWLYFIRPNLKGRKKMGFFKWTLVTLSLRFLFLQKTFLCTKLPCASIHSNYFCRIHTTYYCTGGPCLTYPQLPYNTCMTWFSTNIILSCHKNHVRRGVAVFLPNTYLLGGGPCIMYYLNYQNVWNNKLPKI